MGYPQGRAALERQKSKVIGQRDQVERLRQLQAEVDLRRAQFEKAAARTAELRQEAEVGETNLVPLGSAVTPQSPSFPNMPLIMFGALVFMVALALTGLLVLLQFNAFTIGLGIASLGVVAVYPLMKRVTSWPQAVLGLAFGWGALMGWAAAFGRLDLPPVLLYLGTILWIIGYDTIYAHQDKEDDALIGMRSTALRFGDRTKPWLIGLYGLAWLMQVLAGSTAGAGPLFLVLMLAALGHLAWQIATLDTEDSVNCLARFRSNRGYGALLFLAILADSLRQSVL